MTVALPPSDPADLGSFPAKTLSPDYPYSRLHHVRHAAEWFCTDRDCRFDPPAGAAFGTCYLAGNPVGAYLEKFGRLRIVTRSLVDQQVLTKLQLHSSLRVADLTDRSSGDGTSTPRSGPAVTTTGATCGQLRSSTLVSLGSGTPHATASTATCTRSRSSASRASTPTLSSP